VAEQRPVASIEAVENGLASQGYIASRQIATAVYLSEQIAKPILVEGPAGNVVELFGPASQGRP